MKSLIHNICHNPSVLCWLEAFYAIKVRGNALKFFLSPKKWGFMQDENMDNHIKEFFCQFSDESPHGNFHKVIALHDATDMSWESIFQMVSNLPRGWFELTQLPTADRLEFTQDFWMSKIPFHPHLPEFLDRFFSTIDDIGVYITQEKFDDPFAIHMVYSISENRGFYRGAIPATDDEVVSMQGQFSEFILPDDYVAFLQIHNGFWKTTDCTGLIQTNKLYQTYLEFQEMLETQGTPTTPSGDAVNPHSLIPFYESFGMPFFQCFWGEWHSENEMGNVYYSSTTNTISAINGEESMSFPRFTDWLMFYLEEIG